MDQQLVEMIRDRFDRVDTALEEARATMHAHIEKDEQYWKQLDQQSGQISLLKWLGGGAGLTIIGKWIYERLP